MATSKLLLTQIPLLKVEPFKDFQFAIKNGKATQAKNGQKT